MALLFMDGFDGGDMALKWAVNGTSSSAVTRFSAGRSAQTGGSSNGIKRLFSASTQVFVGVAMSTNSLDGTMRPYMSLYGDNGATLHLQIGYSTSALVLNRGGTNIATAPLTFTANSWYYIEVAATIATTGGTCVVKVNGTTAINFTGNTKNGGTNSTIDGMFCSNNNLSGAAFFDDVYVCDGTGAAPYNTNLGEIRIYALSPTAAGSSTQFTPSVGANYTTVDELPYSATDYVTSGTIGNRDTYTTADLPASASSVLALQTNIIARKSDAAPINLKSALVAGGTVYYGASKGLGASDAAYVDMRTTNPATSAAWTVADVNGLETGFEVS